MNVSLQRSFERLQQDTKALLKEVSAVSAATYHHKPADGRWSISQILTHLLTSEKLSLAYMKKKSLGIETLENTGFLESLKFFFLKLSQRMPLKFEAPRQVIERTPSPLSYGDLVRHWEAVRTELRDFIEKLEEHNVKKKIYKHPRVGMLDANQAIQFLAEHVNHHRPQVRTIIEDLRRKKLEKH